MDIVQQHISVALIWSRYPSLQPHTDILLAEDAGIYGRNI